MCFCTYAARKALPHVSSVAVMPTPATSMVRCSKPTGSTSSSLDTPVSHTCAAVACVLLVCRLV